MIWDGEWNAMGSICAYPKKMFPTKKEEEKWNRKSYQKRRTKLKFKPKIIRWKGKRFSYHRLHGFEFSGMCSIFIVVGTKKKQRLNSFSMKLMKEQTEVKPKSFFFIIVVVDVLLVVSSQFIPCLLSCPLDKTKASLPTKWKKKSFTQARTHTQTHWMACNNHKNTGLARLQSQKLPKEMFVAVFEMRTTIQTHFSCTSS